MGVGGMNSLTLKTLETRKIFKRHVACLETYIHLMMISDTKARLPVKATTIIDNNAECLQKCDI